MRLPTRFVDALPQLGLGRWLDRVSDWTDESRRFAREALDALWVLLLVAACTTPVLLHSLLIALTLDPSKRRPVALLPASV